MLLARLAMLIAAIAAIAWFALGIVQVRDQTRASTLLNEPGTPPASRTAEILRLLDRAGTLNPDRTVDVLRAQAYIFAGDRPAAERVIRRTVIAEPKNVTAWIVLAIAADPRDPATVRLALAMERELVPPVPQAP